MIIDILVLITLVVWVIACIKNRKVILSLPYLLMIFITPIFNILDQNIFVKIFGCGCVPTAQTNMFNIDFNANDLRFTFYNILAIIVTILGVLLSKKITSKKVKVIYVVTIFIINVMLAFKISQLYMWM